MTIKIKTRIVAIVILVAVLVVGLYYFKHAAIQRKLADKPPAKPIVVLFATAKKVYWHDQVQSIGTISALRGVALRAEASGRVTQIFKPSGSAVTKGVPLFQINPKVLQAQLKSNQAAYALSKFEFQRYKKLYQLRAVSLDQLKRMKSTKNIDIAAIEKTKQELALTTIYAPFDGRLGLKRVDVGDYVQAGDIISTFQSLGRFRVDFSIPEKYALRVKPGLTVTLTKTSTTKENFTGTVYAYNPLLNPDTRMLDIRAHVHTTQLLPGMFTMVTLAFNKDKAVLIIPQTAVIQSLHGDYVYKVIHGKAKKVFVKPGKRRGDMIAILFGLKAGEVVVSVGQMKIHDGSEVTNKNPVLPKKTVYHES